MSLLKQWEWEMVEEVASPFNGGPGPINLSVNYFSDRTHYNVYNGKSGMHVQTYKDPGDTLFDFEFEEEYSQWRRYRYGSEQTP